MNKIAETIINGDETEQAFQAVKLGFCQAMSEFGLAPSDAEEIMKVAINKGAFMDPVDMAKEVMMLGAVGGAGIGVGTAMIRHKIEQTADNAETPEMRATRSKINMYKKMLGNAQDQQVYNNSQATQGTV